MPRIQPYNIFNMTFSIQYEDATYYNSQSCTLVQWDVNRQIQVIHQWLCLAKAVGHRPGCLTVRLASFFSDGHRLQNWIHLHPHLFCLSGYRNHKYWLIITKSIFRKPSPLVQYRFLHPSGSDFIEWLALKIFVEVIAVVCRLAFVISIHCNCTYSEISIAPFFSFWAARTNTLIPSRVHIFLANSLTYWLACFSANLGTD